MSFLLVEFGSCLATTAELENPTVTAAAMRRIETLIRSSTAFVAWFPGMDDAEDGCNEGLGALSAIFDAKKMQNPKMNSAACKSLSLSFFEVT